LANPKPFQKSGVAAASSGKRGTKSTSPHRGTKSYFLNRLDLCHMPPDFGERQYESRTYRGDLILP